MAQVAIGPSSIGLSSIGLRGICPRRIGPSSILLDGSSKQLLERCFVMNFSGLRPSHHEILQFSSTLTV